MKQLNLLFLCILLSLSIWAQENNLFTFNHIALSVKDLNQSATFYKDILGLQEITNRTKMEGIRWFSFGEGKELHLISTIKQPVVTNKAVHIALSTNLYDEFIVRLNKASVSFSDWPGVVNKINIRADGIKQIYFQDPNGYWIEINSVAPIEEPVDQIKNEVWQKEINYWKYVKNHDLVAYRTLWDENFIGYPSNNIISNKDHITDWLKELYKDTTRVFSYELNRNVENVFGDIVIVLYDVIHTWTNEKNEVVKQSTYKVTHTWKKSDNGWLIIGGMGALK